MAESSSEKSGLQMVYSRAEGAEGKLTLDEFYEDKVLPLFREMASIILGKKSSRDHYQLKVPDRLVDELRNILEKDGLKEPHFKNCKGREEWMQGKMAVRLIEDYSCFSLVVRRASDDEIAEQFPPERDYYFNPRDFRARKSGTDYSGKRYWEVQEMVESKSGKNSDIARNVTEVRRLIKALLYNTDLKEEERETMAGELFELKMAVGAAAAAVIDDYIGDYFEGDGWVEAVDEVNDTGIMPVDVENTMAYASARSRLQVGRFDLNKLRSAA